MTFKPLSEKLEIEDIKELGKLSEATKALKASRDFRIRSNYQR